MYCGTELPNIKNEKTMKKKSNLTLFMKQLIRSLKEEERFSTAHIYQSTLNASYSSARPMPSGSTRWNVHA